MRETAICTWLILIFKIVILHFIPLLISQRIESVNQLYIHAQATRRGSADRPDHGGVRAAVLRAEPAAVRGARHVLHPLLLHHHAQHHAAQPQRQDQAHARRLRQPEQGHQLGQGPPQAHAGEGIDEHVYVDVGLVGTQNLSCH